MKWEQCQYFSYDVRCKDVKKFYTSYTTGTKRKKRKRKQSANIFLTFASNCKDGKASDTGAAVVVAAGVATAGGTATGWGVVREAELETGTSKGPHGIISPAAKEK